MELNNTFKLTYIGFQVFDVFATLLVKFCKFRQIHTLDCWYRILSQERQSYSQTCYLYNNYMDNHPSIWFYFDDISHI